MSPLYYAVGASVRSAKRSCELNVSRSLKRLVPPLTPHCMLFVGTLCSSKINRADSFLSSNDYVHRTTVAINPADGGIFI